MKQASKPDAVETWEPLVTAEATDGLIPTKVVHVSNAVLISEAFAMKCLARECDKSCPLRLKRGALVLRAYLAFYPRRIGKSMGRGFFRRTGRADAECSCRDRCRPRAMGSDDRSLAARIGRERYIREAFCTAELSLPCNRLVEVEGVHELSRVGVDNPVRPAKPGSTESTGVSEGFWV